MEFSENYLTHISNLIWNFISEESYQLAKKILSSKEHNFLADVNLLNQDIRVIYDYFFVIDKFKNTKIPPQKYEIKYSSSFNRSSLNDVESANLDLIISIIQNGQKNQFEILNKFFPNSSKSFITKPYNSSEHRYNVDFSGSIWGIKHLHLKATNRGDTLLYYCIVENIIYFFAIGKHKNMYDKSLLEIIVNEFPTIISNLGIGHYQDMTFNNFDNYSTEVVKKKWLNGENIGFFINEKFYTSINLMTHSKIKANINYTINNISYQINNQANEFLKSICEQQKVDSTLNIIIDDYKDLFKGELLIKEENQKKAQFFYISYLKQLNETKELLNIYCKNEK